MPSVSTSTAAGAAFIAAQRAQDVQRQRETHNDIHLNHPNNPANPEHASSTKHADAIHQRAVDEANKTAAYQQVRQNFSTQNSIDLYV